MIKWGVIGLGRIAHRFVESLAHFENAQFYAGASKNPNKRKEYEELYHPDIIYSDYYALLDDENIDVVYIALPHGMHYQWCLEALKRGKNVFVEKPATLNSKELIELTDYAREHQLFFMEAMKTRFIPLINKIHEEINKGVIGDIQTISDHFTYEIRYLVDHYLFDPKQGGALYDVGSYCIAGILDFVKSDIVNIEGKIRFNHGVDTSNKVTLTFENGIVAHLEAAIDTPNNREMIIEGTKGQIHMMPFYRPEEATVTLEEGTVYTMKQEIPYDDFYPEIQAVHEGILSHQVESKRMSHQDSIDIIQTIEKIRDKLYYPGNK